MQIYSYVAICVYVTIPSIQEHDFNNALLLNIIILSIIGLILEMCSKA